MKVRMTAGMSGTRNGQPWPALGEELTVSDAEGVDLCAAGVAVPVASAKAEHALLTPNEVRKAEGMPPAKPRTPRK